MSYFNLSKIVALRLKEIFEVNSRKLDYVLGALPDYFFGIGFQDAWEVWVHGDLICVKDPHVSYVCHSLSGVYE